LGETNTPAAVESLECPLPITNYQLPITNYQLPDFGFGIDRQ
jgi:hypothetical protein